MPTTNPKVDLFLKKSPQWRAEMAALRTLLLDCGLSEDFKWYKPCYTWDGGIVVILAGLKDHCWLAFHKGALMQDPQGLLAKPGDNTRSGRVIKFTGMDAIAGQEDVIRRYILDAIAVEKAGLKVELRSDDGPPMPDELLEKFAAMPELKTAFEALTPGRQRAYRLHFSGAKQSKTRTSRIEACTPDILAGKGFNEP